jgi:PAS domain S-box-containing protein
MNGHMVDKPTGPRSDQRWEWALESAGDGIWDWDTRTDEVFFSKHWKSMLGYEDDEISGHFDEWDKRLHPEDRKHAHKLLDDHLCGKTPHYECEHRLHCKDGTYKWILTRGKVIERDDEGKPLRVIGTHTDITKRIKFEDERTDMEARLAIRAKELSLLYEVTTEVLQQTEFESALKRCLDLVCIHMGWPVGHVYLRSAEGSREELISSGLWHLDNKETFQTFREITEQSRFQRGVGLPGRVWESNRVAWIRDTHKDRNFPRAKQGKKLGILGCVAFPVMVNNHIEAVLEFFSSNTVEPDKDLQQVLEAVGCQLGDILERQRESHALALANEKLEELLQQRNQEIRTKEQIQHELEVNKQQLEELIEWRTKELTDANQRLWQEVLGRKHAQMEAEKAQHEAEQANQAKSEFLANMSHELRTPMHAILSFSDFGLSKLESANREKLGHYFERINTSGHRLLHLLNELLDLSKLEAGKMELTLQQCNPLEIIQLCVDELHALANDRNQRIEVQAKVKDQMIPADSKRLLQVIRNLLSNAIKFSSEGKTIEVTLSNITFTPDEDEQATPGIQIQVADRGIGIPEGELENIFDKFIQSTKTATGAGGTGLGLAISKEIVGLHHGHIYAENREGGGTVFSVELPATIASTADS